MATDYEGFLSRIDRRPPATQSAIDEFEQQTGRKLPGDYVEFLKTTNGGSGFVGSTPAAFWAIEELAWMNMGYEVHEWLPGGILFGTDLCGNAFGFDTRSPVWTIFTVEFIPMDWGFARSLGTSFFEFLEFLSNDDYFTRLMLIETIE